MTVPNILADLTPGRHHLSLLDENFAYLDGVITGSYQVYALTYGVSPGNADDTAHLQAAIDAVNAAGGGTVILPAGTINVAGVVLKSKVYLKGAGRAATVLKLKNGANVDVLFGLNAYSLFGTLSTSGISDWGLSDLTIDGNRANNSSGNGLATYGYRFIVENVIIQNCAEMGWHSEGGQPVTDAMEANIRNVLIDTTGTHGAYFDGPHDSNIGSLTIIDASQTTNNASYGLLFGAHMTARVSGFHGWHRSTVTNRAAFQFYDTAGGSNFTNSQFEGSYQAAMKLAGNTSQFDDSNTYYSPWNTGTPSVIVNGSNNTLKGTILGSIYIPATPDRIGLTLGGAGNTIDLMVLGSKLGAVDFTFDTGLNDVKIRGSQAGGPGYIGTPPSTDAVDLIVSGAASLGKFTQYPGNRNLASGSAYQINGTQVVGARDTGWTAMTGTPNKAATYDVATVTLAQLAARVAQLQAILTAHGLIGA